MRPGSQLLRLLVALVIGPTSLNGGEGLLPGRCVWLEVSWVVRPVKCNEFLYLEDISILEFPVSGVRCPDSDIL
jgi:hypothetical protein